MENEKGYILWLPSWYPTKYDRYNGDFIQRHALATSAFDNIRLLHFAPSGPYVTVEEEHTISVKGNLTEYIIYIPFKPTRLTFIDKIYYHIKYYRYAKAFIKKHFRAFGLPKLTHAHVPVKAGNLALWIKRKFKIPYIVSEHGSYYETRSADSYDKRHFIYRMQVRKVFENADLVTNVSSAVAEILRKLFAIKKMEVVHNVVDTTIFKPGHRNNELFTYIHVSTLTEQKNIIGLLNAFQKLSRMNHDWRLIIVGPAKKEEKTYIIKNNLTEYINLTGEVSYEEVAGYMQQANVFVLFSKHENFPCVIIEALCCGLPVLSTAVGGISEAVNRSNGILIKEGDEEALLNGLMELRVNFNHYNLTELANEAKEKYSYDKIGRQFHDIYKGFKH